MEEHFRDFETQSPGFASRRRRCPILGDCVVVPSRVVRHQPPANGYAAAAGRPTAVRRDRVHGHREDEARREAGQGVERRSSVS